MSKSLVVESIVRHFFVILLSACFFAAVPPIPKAAEAKSLFESLFPRAAERRKQRIRRQRQRQLFEIERQRKELRRQRSRERAVIRRRNNPIGQKKSISGPKYYTYRARGLGYVPTGKLVKTFAKQAAVAQAAVLAEQQLRIENHFYKERMNIDSFARLAPAETPARFDWVTASEAVSRMRIKARPAAGKAIVAHYSKSPSFIWLSEDGSANEQAEVVVEMLASAESVGLSSSDYEVPVKPTGSEVEESVAFELSLTARALRYFSDAKYGLVDPNRISGYHDFSSNFANYGKLMAALAAAPDPAKLLNNAHPRDAAFAALKAELAAIKDAAATALPPVEIASGTFIRPGDIDTEVGNVVEAIRRRASDKIKQEHAAVLAADHSVGDYSPEVEDLVRATQTELGLKPDGIIGKNTIRRLLAGRKASPKVRRDKILFAMERLRWHPDSLGNTHVMINQPAYRVAMKQGGRTKIAMNVVVGKKSNQTYFFQDQISYVEFNPYWGIPRSILVNEYLPKLRRNAGYLDDRGYELSNVRGRALSSWDVDWWGVGSDFPFNVRQPPGPKNALGRLKIMFPNKHSIYMHDTPAKSLFSRKKRAFSHGCVRLAEPRKMAAAVLGTSLDYVNNSIAQGENKTRKLKRKIPVYVSYFTAWPNDAGKVRFYSDIYGRDTALRKAINAERRMRGSDNRA